MTCKKLYRNEKKEKKNSVLFCYTNTIVTKRNSERQTKHKKINIVGAKGITKKIRPSKITDLHELFYYINTKMYLT